MKKQLPVVVILGPTATGKTRIAAQVAASLDGEVISADSRQVYRGMTIGTGKDYDDYTVNGQAVPYHLIDIADPGTEYNLFRYQQDFHRALESIRGRQKVPVVCGGTGLYLNSVLKGYSLKEAPADPELREVLDGLEMDALREMFTAMKVPHNTTDMEDRDRLIRAIEIARIQGGEVYSGQESLNYPGILGQSMVFGIHFDREVVRKRITQRLEKRLAEGLVDEVNQLLDDGLRPEQLEFYGLEYRYVTGFLTGKYTYAEMFEKLNTAIHQFAKKQMTWFRKMEREGVEIKWIEGMLPQASKVQIICGRLRAF